MTTLTAAADRSQMLSGRTDDGEPNITINGDVNINFTQGDANNFQFYTEQPNSPLGSFDSSHEESAIYHVKLLAKAGIISPEEATQIINNPQLKLALFGQPLAEPLPTQQLSPAKEPQDMAFEYIKTLVAKNVITDSQAQDILSNTSKLQALNQILAKPTPNTSQYIEKLFNLNNQNSAAENLVINIFSAGQLSLEQLDEYLNNPQILETIEQIINNPELKNQNPNIPIAHPAQSTPANNFLQQALQNGDIDQTRFESLISSQIISAPLNQLLQGNPDTTAIRAAQVLTQTGGAGSTADQHISQALLSGTLSIDEFKTLASDIPFLTHIDGLLQGSVLEKSHVNSLIENAKNNISTGNPDLLANASPIPNPDENPGLNDPLNDIVTITPNGNGAALSFASVDEAITQWTQEGILNQAQATRLLTDPQLRNNVQTLIDNGGGTLEIRSAADQQLEAIENKDWASVGNEGIKAILDKGFDLTTGPSQEQLAALNYLAGGQNYAYYEILLEYTRVQHPNLELQYNPTREMGDDYATYEDYPGITQAFRFTMVDNERNSTGDTVESPFLNQLRSKLRSSGNIAHTGNFEQKDNPPDGPDKEGMVQKRVRKSEDKWYSVSTDLDTLGITNVFNEEGNEEDAKSGGLDTILNLIGYTQTEDGFHVAGRENENLQNFSLTENDIEESFADTRENDNRGALYREMLEIQNPELLEGKEVILLNTDNNTVTSDTKNGNVNVIDIGGTNNNIDLSNNIGDSYISSYNTTNAQFNLGAGNVSLNAAYTHGMNITDLLGAQNKATSIILRENHEEVNLTADDGNTQTTAASNANIEHLNVSSSKTQKADGNTAIQLLDGSTIHNADINFDETNGHLDSQAGSILNNAAIDGGDGSDNFILGGEINLREGTDLNLGQGNDSAFIKGTFSNTSEFNIGDDGQGHVESTNLDDVKDYDSVSYEHGSFEHIDGQLVRVDEEGNTVAAIGFEGGKDKDYNGLPDFIERIQSVNKNGDEVDPLQDIPPEVRMRWGWMSIASSIAFAVAPVFPPAVFVGVGLSVAHDAANDQLSVKRGISTGISALTGAGLGTAAAAATAANVAYSAAEGDLTWGSAFQQGANIALQSGAFAQSSNAYKAINTAKNVTYAGQALESGDYLGFAQGVGAAGGNYLPSSQAATLNHVLQGANTIDEIKTAVETGNIGALENAVYKISGQLVEQGVIPASAQEIIATALTTKNAVQTGNYGSAIANVTGQLENNGIIPKGSQDIAQAADASVNTITALGGGDFSDAYKNGKNLYNSYKDINESGILAGADDNLANAENITGNTGLSKFELPEDSLINPEFSGNPTNGDNDLFTS